MRTSAALTLALGLGLTGAAVTPVPPSQDTLVARALSVSELESSTALHLLQSRGLLEDVWDAITDAASCAGCQSLLGLFKGLALLGEDVFTTVIQEVCKLANVQDDEVCEGAIGLQTPVIYKAIREMKLGSKTSDLFCITFLGLCSYPDVTPFEPEFPSPRPNIEGPGPSCRDPIKVVHIADTHIDPLYVEGASTECGKPICCRPYTAQDAPGQTQNPAGRWGDASCSTPVSLEQSMLSAINELVPDAAFGIFTGDMVHSVIWNTSRSLNEEIIMSSYSRMAEVFSTMYIAVGNHEMHPTNLIAPKSISDSAQWMYDAVASSVSGWLGEDAATTIRQFGGYSVKHAEGNLRIIGLNTNFYYTNNYYMFQEEMDPDPESQLTWLVSELDAAESKGENVWIVGHQPFGDPRTFHDATTSIDRIVNRYSDSIRAMFFGHTHSDHFQITYSDYANRTAANARVTSYINPSLVPASGRNPAFRVYDVDPETFAILDVTTYFVDMNDPSFTSAASGPGWKKYYSAKEAYGSLLASPPDEFDELTPAFWHEVTEVFESDPDAFAAYLSRKSRGFRDEEPCTGDCLAQEVCQLRAARSEDNCFVPSPGINLRKMRRWEVEDIREQDSEEVARAAIAAVAQNKEALRLLAETVARKRV